MSADQRLDFPITDRLTASLVLREDGHLHLSMYWGPDPSDTMGTDVYAWRGCWKSPLSTHVTPDEVVSGIIRRVAMTDLSGPTINALKERAGALREVVRDVALHHLALSVMAS